METPGPQLRYPWIQFRDSDTKPIYETMNPTGGTPVTLIRTPISYFPETYVGTLGPHLRVPFILLSAPEYLAFF